jgi:hypothetical protein
MLILLAESEAEHTFGYHLAGVRRIDIECLACGCRDELVVSFSKEQRTVFATDPALPCCQLTAEL